MPVNPYEGLQQAAWGGKPLTSRTQGAANGQMGAGSLSGQGHRSNPNMVAPTFNELKPTPKASGKMPQGNANIGSANYGQQKIGEPQQRQGRRASFGGMGPGAVKGGGGGGMTAGGNITFDLSQGKTTVGDGATFGHGATIGAGAKGGTIKDNMIDSTVDQSQTFSPTVSGGKAGSGRGGAAAAGRGGASGAGGAGGSRSGAGTGGAGGAGRGGNVGDTMSDMSGVKFGSPSLKFGSGKSVGRDDMSDNSRMTFNSKTNTNNNDNRKPPQEKREAATKIEPSKPETQAESPKKRSKPATSKTKTAEPKNVSKTPAKEAPKSEAASKQKAKDAAKKSVKEAVDKGPADASKGAVAAKKKTKKAGSVTKDEE